MASGVFSCCIILEDEIMRTESYELIRPEPRGHTPKQCTEYRRPVAVFNVCLGLLCFKLIIQQSIFFNS